MLLAFVNMVLPRICEVILDADKANVLGRCLRQHKNAGAPLDHKKV